ncbi:MAG: hypothetical protein J5656_06765 [Clostridia bacterium]|nr:hypothetical protein [Clostridia bacterium]
MNFDVSEICINCKYFRWYYDRPQCWGKKNAPVVEWDYTCKDFTRKEEEP